MRRLRKCHLKSEFALPQTLSCLFQLAQIVKCWQIDKKTVFPSSGKEKAGKSLSSFTSSTKQEIRHFYCVVVQRRRRNVQKSVMNVQSCCFANLTLMLFCCTRCRRRLCVSSQIFLPSLDPQLRN